MTSLSDRPVGIHGHGLHLLSGRCEISQIDVASPLTVITGYTLVIDVVSVGSKKDFLFYFQLLSSLVGRKLYKLHGNKMVPLPGSVNTSIASPQSLSRAVNQSSIQVLTLLWREIIRIKTGGSLNRE